MIYFSTEQIDTRNISNKYQNGEVSDLQIFY